MKILNSTQLTAGVLALAVSLGACKRADRADETTPATIMTNADSSLQTGLGEPDEFISVSLTDGEILAMVEEINEGEIELGKVARDKATNADVKAFAREMVSAHEKMEDDAEALAKRLNVDPKSAASDSLAMDNKAMKERQESIAKGMQFDTAYINSQVMGHEKALAFIHRASMQTANTELKSWLTTTETAVQKHLDQAKALKSKLM